jgi:hypothetical protein
MLAFTLARPSPIILCQFDAIVVPANASKHSNETMNEILRRISPLEGNKAGIMDEVRRIGREMQDGVFINQ